MIDHNHQFDPLKINLFVLILIILALIGLLFVIPAKGGEMKIPKYGKDCRLGAVEWLDAIGFQKEPNVLTQATPSQLLHANPNITIGCISEDKDALLIVSEISVFGDKTYANDFTIIPKNWVVKIQWLKEVKK